MLRFFVVILSLFTTVTYASEIEIKAKDGISLKGFANKTSADKAVLFLHQCNREQTMWKPVVNKLSYLGYSTTTVDFRGFGLSKSNNYNIDESDEDYMKASKYVKDDVHDIYHHWLLQTKNAKKRVVVGASCGGGAAGILAANYNEINGLVLLSPSMRDYWMPEENWEKLSLKKDLPVLTIAAKEDKNAMTAINRVTEMSQAKDTQYVRYNGKLHGDPLFKHDKILADNMVNWIVKVTSN